MPAEAVGVDGGGGDDDLEVGAAGEQLLQVAENEVNVQAALVRLIEDERVVAAQLLVPLHLGQQDAVGHDLDQRVVTGVICEAHLVADRRAQLGPKLVSDPFRHGAGCDPARLGMADLAGDAPAQLKADLRQLRGLAATGLPGDDHHLMIADDLGDLVFQLADRKLGRIRNDRQGAPARLDPGRCRVQFRAKPGERPLAGSRVGQPRRLVDALA